EEELADLRTTLQSWVNADNPEDAVTLTSLPNDTTFQGKSITERLLMSRDPETSSHLINPQRANLNEILNARYKGTEYEELMNKNMRNASGTVDITGLIYGRMALLLMKNAGGDATTEEIVRMYDNLLSVGKGSKDPEEIQARDAKFETGFRQLKQIYLEQLRRMKGKYGICPTQMHPEDFLNKVGIDYFDDMSIVQDLTQMMVDGGKYFDYTNHDDAEFKLLSNYFWDAHTRLLAYLYSGLDMNNPAVFNPKNDMLELIDGSDYSERLKVSEKQLREENANIKGFAEKEMAIYLTRVQKRFSVEGKENRLIGRFRKQ
ncbi:MAG: hypothetical protein ACI4TP_07425, partial [Anaerotignum sp.]